MNRKEKEYCKERVLEYLSRQNRPYSVNDILINLKNEFGKNPVQKALDDLTLEQRVKEKIYGKQKVYSIVQEEGDFGFDDTELDKLESAIKEVSEKLNSVDQALKKSENIVKDLEFQPTTEVALMEKVELEQLINKLREKIKLFSESFVQLSDEDKNKILYDRENFTKEYKKRKRLCMDIINSILENYPKKIEVLLEEIGLEADADDDR